MKSLRLPCGLVFSILLLAGSAARGQPESPRERTSFNADWRFTKNDPANTGDALSDAKLKPWWLPTGDEFLHATAPRPVRPEGNIGADVPYTQPTFDDHAWRSVNLPHDWGIEGPFKPEYPGDTGKLPWWGVGWYRKNFNLPATDQGRRIYLDFDGAMSHAAVWLNGQFVGGWPYGYASWRVDLTPFVHFGADNVVAIRLNNSDDSSRWYPGGGIYRNVWLVKTNVVHVAHWGTFITTPVVSPERAVVDVKVTVQNDTDKKVNVDVTTEIYALDPDGHRAGPPVASLASAPTQVIAPHFQSMIARTTALPQPQLWSIKAPHRYVAVSTVAVGGKVTDVYETPFGVRTISFTADNGFLLNGERVLIQGVCDHHDLGALGAAVNVHALARQLRILREMGCNAIRTSHNPPAPELLELADQMGFVVMDEAFDCWAHGKRDHDYHLLFPDWHEQDLRAYVRRDRNHPCVVLWSIGNEIWEQGEPGGWQLANHLAGIVREEDRTRGVTAACNDTPSGYTGFQTVVDVFGYNYKPTEYPKLHAAHPQLPLFGSETASCVSTRGEYFFPVSDDKAQGRADLQVSSYDLYAPPWAWPPDVEFRGLDEAPYVAGEFVWTGFDYLGEPTPYGDDWETHKPSERSRSSYFGIIDLAGFKKDRFFIYQARWRPDFPMAHILPHWTWPDRVGQVTPVHVYTSGDEAELFLNGRSLGRKQRGPLEYRLRWDDVKYEPGELKVVAYKNGAVWAQDVMRTAGAAAKLDASADRPELRADGVDLAYVTVRIEDQVGTLVPRAHNVVKFEVSGPADVIATDNGDPTNLDSFQDPQRAAFNGLVLAIVRTRAGRAGNITIRATSDGLAAGEVTLTSR